MTDTPNNPQAIRQRMATDPAFYRQRIKLEVSGSLKRYADVGTDWQEAAYLPMDRAWLRCIGVVQGDVPRMRSFRECVRGAAKTWGLACRAAWALEFAPRRIKINAYAGDSDQARQLVKATQIHCDVNPWHSLQIQRNIVRNPATGSELEVMSADAATGYGALVDGIIVDEINNWPNTDSALRLWEMIVSTVSKKQNCVLECISNAGRIESWQWPIREAIREDALDSDSLWIFENVRTIPDWITPKLLAEQKRLLSRSAYSRLWENVPSSGTDTGVSPSDYNAGDILPGPLERRESGHELVLAACDLGWRHDRTGLVVLALNQQSGKIHLAYAESWLPQDYGGELPLEVVERELLEVQRRFQLDQLLFDPREATGLSQRLTNKGLPCARLNLSSAVQDDMAKIFLQAFNQRIILTYPHAELQRDILSMEVVDRTVGLKLQAARTSGGHSDLGFAFAMALYGVWNYQPMHVGDEVLYA